MMAGIGGMRGTCGRLGKFGTPSSKPFAVVDEGPRDVAFIR
jgi:hypothetical protein